MIEGHAAGVGVPHSREIVSNCISSVFACKTGIKTSPKRSGETYLEQWFFQKELSENAATAPNVDRWSVSLLAEQ